MAIVLALVSALTYGVSDFVGGFVSRRTSAWAVAVVGLSSSAVCTSVAALLVTGSPEPRDFAWGALGGVGGGMGCGFLYRGLTTGRMSVVAPVSAVGSALVPVVAGAIGGERPAGLVWVGIAVAMPAIWLVSATPSAARDEHGSFAEGLLDGVLAGLGFGLLFACLGQIPDSAGLWPLTLTQVASVPAVIVLAGLVRAPWVPRDRAARWALLCGPLGACATLAFLLATQRGYLTISGVLASLYPASTVVLAMIVLREHIHRAQAIGLALCAVTVALVAAG